MHFNYPYTVNPLPSAILGSSTVCQNFTATFSDATIGGTWTSSNNTIATIGNTTGILSGVNAGSVITSYTSTLGCYVTKTVIVNPAPNVYTVTGGGHYCSGATGTQIGLSNSELGIRYQPYNGSC